MTISHFLKHSALTAGTVSLFGFGVLAITIPTHAAIIDLADEDFTTWDTFGDVLNTSETASMSTNALLNDDSGIGSDSAFNFSGDPADLVGIPFGLEEFLGLDIGDLDPDPAQFVFAFEGSAIKKTFTVEAGDELIFKYRFLTNEPSRLIGPLPDYAFLTLDGLNDAGGNSDCALTMGSGDVLCTVAEVSDATIPSSPYTNKTDKESFSFTFSQGGDFTIGLGVVDVEDFIVSSALQIQPVPEPSTLLGTGLAFGFGLLSRKRKNKKT